MPHHHECNGCGSHTAHKPKKCGQCGGSIFTKMWDGIKKGLKWVKDNKVISKYVVPKIPGVGGVIAGKIAEKTGYGRRRKPTMKGGAKAKPLGMLRM